MKLLRVGDINKEKPAIIDSEGIIKDLSSIIDDLNPKTLNQDTINKIRKINLSKLPVIHKNTSFDHLEAKKSKF